MDSNAMQSSWRNNKTLHTLYLVILGQVASFVLATGSFFSSLIASLGMDAPLTQAAFVYLALTLVYGIVMLRRGCKLLVPWYWYLLLSFIDVHGNSLVNKAYQFTSLTSATLLCCLTIAWAIVLTWIFLGTRYSIWQLVGAGVGVVGIGIVLFSDVGAGGGGGSNPLLGDTFVIVGTIFFAVCNVSQEFCVKKKDRVELLFMVSVFGLLWSLGEISIFEMKNLNSIKWSADIVLAVAGYTFSGFLLYTFVLHVLKLSGSTMFNLSALTSNMWAVVLRVLFYHEKIDWLYYLAFAVVVTGLVIYSITDKNPSPASASEHEHMESLHQKLIDENAACSIESVNSISRGVEC